VVIAGLTTMAGFGGLMLGNYGAMLTVGLALTVGVGACLVASILVLPPLLLALRRVD
jgi:predicted RND superfamily exporter protein